MALLLNKTSAGRADDVISADLSEKMSAVQSKLIYADDSPTFIVSRNRLWIDEFTARASEGHEITGVSTVDRSFSTPLGAVETRVYNPHAFSPIVIFVHGGGWTIGSVKTHDHITRWIAAELNGKVVSIEYGLAPENPFPAAVIQCSAVISQILTENRNSPVFLAGDSAGANIAAMAILTLQKTERHKLAGFISIYGAYSPEMNLSSHKLYGDGRFGLSEAQMRWFWNLYAPQIPVEERARLLSPLGAKLDDFPPTLCVGAEWDILLDDTLAFYGELTKACTDVTLSLWSGLPHGCMHFVGVVESVTQAAGTILQFINSHLQRPKLLVSDKPPGASSNLSLILPQTLFTEISADLTNADILVDVEPIFTTSRSRLHGSVAHRIAADIIKGILQPGSLLPNEENASASYGVSRSAYREAIRTLAAKGLVRALPKVGTRITERLEWQILDPDVLAWHFELEASDGFIRTLFELRKIVEPNAAALVAMRRTDEQLSKLADALARMARMNPRTGTWLNAIVSFHKVILTACGNEAVASLWPAIQTTLRWSVKLQMMLPTLVLEHDPVADHARVLEKIASQNAEGAVLEMALLIDSSLRDTLTNIRRINVAKESVN